jgi:hypothetical protein
MNPAVSLLAVVFLEPLGTVDPCLVGGGRCSRAHVMRCHATLSLSARRAELPESQHPTATATMEAGHIAMVTARLLVSQMHVDNPVTLCSCSAWELVLCEAKPLVT